MEQERTVLETDGEGRLKAVPPLPPDATIEVTFRVLKTSSKGSLRMPPVELAAVEIVGDIMNPAIDEGDWGFMK
jgi:hypothetical protein